MNSVLSPLYLELLQPPIRSTGDTSLWSFFVERRDTGSVSLNTATQEESDQICLFHIWKSCSFQGEWGEPLRPVAGGTAASSSQSSALTSPLKVLSPIQRGSGILTCKLVALQ